MGDTTLYCAVIYISMVEICSVPSLMWHKRNGTCNLSKVHPQRNSLHRTVGFLSPISIYFLWLASSHRFLKCTVHNFRWGFFIFLFWANMSLIEWKQDWIKMKPWSCVQYTESLCMCIYMHTQCCSSSRKLTFNGNHWVMYPCTLPTTAEVLTKKLLTWSRRWGLERWYKADFVSCGDCLLGQFPNLS